MGGLISVFANATVTAAQSCNPVVDFYPVRGPHDHGYDSAATGDPKRWTCNDAHSNSDFIKANNAHVGNDIWAAEGTPVVAASAGRIGTTECHHQRGCNTGFTDACGWYHWATHLQKIANGISKGTWVTAGTTIGYVGKTGTLANGVVHLHYSIYPPDNYYAGIDPWPHLHKAERNVCEAASHAPRQTFLNVRSSDVDGDGLSDICARGATGIRCWPSSASGWQDAWEPIPWSDAVGWDHPIHYSTLRMGDVNGDGLEDVCGRAVVGVYCALSTGSGFREAKLWQPELTNERGWGEPQYYTTLRIVDMDGDDKDDLCARDSAGFGCWLSDGTQFAKRVEGPRWSNDSGFDDVAHYGTLRMGDIDGDGRTDVCARTAEGMTCSRAGIDAFGPEIAGPSWSNESGFNKVEHWSTLRMTDINGDAKDDLCIRTAADLRCHLSHGDGFDEALIVAELSNALGWSDPTNYQTLRTGDINGDGADDLCARSNTEMVCWVWNGASFDTVRGPQWSDAKGWDEVTYFDTIRLVDFNGDGLSDLCARASAGWLCHASQGNTFADAIELGDLKDTGGWEDPKYFGTIMSGGISCRALQETCNGKDDDCDSEVDEDDACPPSAADSGTTLSDSGVHQPLEGGTGKDSGTVDVAPDPPASSCTLRPIGASSRMNSQFLALIVGLMLLPRRRRPG